MNWHIAIALLFLTSSASAEWVEKKCYHDFSRDTGHALQFSSPNCEQKLCEMREICSEIDSGTIAGYGGIDKIPADVLPRVTLWTTTSCITQADGDTCPDFETCRGDDPKHIVNMKWVVPAGKPESPPNLLPGGFGLPPSHSQGTSQ